MHSYLTTEQLIEEIAAQKGLDASVIPGHRMELMQAKYKEYKQKWSHMNEKRLVRKVAEYFKIKLV